MQRTTTILLILLILLPFLGSLVHSSKQVTLYDTTVSSKNFDLKSLTIYSDKIVLNGVFPFSTTINNSSPDFTAITNIEFTILFDLDYNYTTGVQGKGFYKENAPGIESDIIVYVTSKYNNIYHYIGVCPMKQNELYSYCILQTNNYKVHISRNNITLYINWSNLINTYKEYTKNNIENTTKHRAYIFLYSPNSYLLNIKYTRLDYPQLEIITNEDISNKSGLQKFTIPNATIHMNGSPRDWPASAVAYVNGPVDIGDYPGFVDARAVYMSADSNYFYLGIKLGGVIPSSIFNNKYNYFYIFIYLDLNNDGKTETTLGIYKSGKMDNYYVYLYNSTITKEINITDTIRLTVKNNMIEIAVPRNKMPTDLHPGETLGVNGGNYQLDVTDFLDKPIKESYPVIREVSIDTQTGEVYSAGYYNVYNKSINPGNNTIAGSPYATAIIPRVNKPITVVLGATGVPPINATLPPLIPEYSIGGMYYLTINDTNNITWPIKLELHVINPGNKVLVYYYYKNYNAYKQLPSSYYTYNPITGNLTITLTRELYQLGDPGIIVYSSGASSVGGYLLPEQQAETHYTIPLASLAILAITSVLAGLLSKRKNSI